MFKLKELNETRNVYLQKNKRLEAPTDELIQHKLTTERNTAGLVALIVGIALVALLPKPSKSFEPPCRIPEIQQDTVVTKKPFFNSSYIEI